MARRISERELGEQLYKEAMRANSDRNKASRQQVELSRFGFAFLIIGVIGTVTFLILGEDDVAALGVVLVGIGTVLINR